MDTKDSQEGNIKLSPTKKNKTEENNESVETVSNLVININKCNDKEISNSSDNDMQDHSESQTAALTKIENTHVLYPCLSYNSPCKPSSLRNPNSENCKNEIISKDEIITSSPRKHKSGVRFSSTVLQQLFKESPISKGRETLQSDNKTMNIYTERRKRKSSTDCYGLYNSSQSYIADDSNNFESIDLLHDTNPIIDYQESKASSDILFPPMTNDSSTAQEIKDDLIDMNNDPPTDPLFIGDLDEENHTDILVDSGTQPLGRRRSDRLRNKQSEIHNDGPPKKRKHKLNTKEKGLLEKLEDIEESEERMLLDAREKLQALHIELVHKVPSQHKIELTGAHAPAQRERKLFQMYGPLRKGPYSPMEDEVIVKNWQMFCKLHKWDSSNAEPFLNSRHNGKYYIRKVQERQKFVQFLANGLPWRTLYSVYSRFKILHCNKITQVRYTPNEDKAILMYIQNNHLNMRENKYTELAKLLGRTRRSISKRYRYLKESNSESEEKSSINIRWTLPLIKRFIKSLLSATLSENINELKYATLPKPVWQKMEKELNIDGKVLKAFWQHQLHLQLFSTSPIYLNDIKIQLIEYMYGKGISSTRGIIWPNVAQYFIGATAVFLCKTFYYLVQECNINNMDNFIDIVEYLYHTKIPEIQNSPTDKFLPRITYENGKIDVLDAADSNNVIYAADTVSEEADNDISDNCTSDTSQ